MIVSMVAGFDAWINLLGCMLQLLFVLPLTFALAKRVEPELGSMNTLRLLLVANVGASFIIFVQMFSLYIIFREPAYLYVHALPNVFVSLSSWLRLRTGTRVCQALLAASQLCLSRS